MIVNGHPAIAGAGKSRDACAGCRELPMNPITHSEKFHVAADHPALPGHFPGAPVVPGVVLLDCVVAVVQRVWRMQVSGLPQVKFLRPLPPGQPVQLTIECDAAGMRFHIVEGTHSVASGLIQARA
jgi:3-hydroxyacyl-[acyl-carrier-protein] dehydratase